MSSVCQCIINHQFGSVMITSPPSSPVLPGEGHCNLDQMWRGSDLCIIRLRCRKPQAAHDMKSLLINQITKNSVGTNPRRSNKRVSQWRGRGGRVALKDPGESNNVPSNFLIPPLPAWCVYLSSPVQSSRVVRLLTRQSAVFSPPSLLLFFFPLSLNFLCPVSFLLPFLSIFPMCFTCWVHVSSHSPLLSVLSCVCSVPWWSSSSLGCNVCWSSSGSVMNVNWFL